MTDPKIVENIKTPFYAAVGTGDLVVQAVADVVSQVRARAENTNTDVSGRIDEARNAGQPPHRGGRASSSSASVSPRCRPSCPRSSPSCASGSPPRSCARSPRRT